MADVVRLLTGMRAAQVRAGALQSCVSKISEVLAASLGQSPVQWDANRVGV